MTNDNLAPVEQLAPCPFCHGAAATTETRAVIVWHGAECTVCGAQIEKPTEAEAIAAWNRRSRPAPIADVAGLVERLRASAKAFRENPIYDADGDGFYLTVQAKECEDAADLLERLASPPGEDEVKDKRSIDAVWARFYRDGKDLGQIAEEFGGTVYDYSPWLTAPIVRAALRDREVK